HGVESKFYGAFRNAKVSSVKDTWTATMKPTPAVAGNTKSAGPRAKSKEAKPSMKLHWLNPQDGKAILAEAPRNRYSKELHNKSEARKAWSKDLMPKIIVNRKGENLKSTFVALWEPYSKTPFLNKVEKLVTKNNKGFAWKVSDENINKTILYRAPELNSDVVAADVTTDANFTVVSSEENAQSIDFSGGENFTNDTFDIRVTHDKPMEVLQVTRNKGDFSLLIKGTVSQVGKVYKDQYVCFSLDSYLNRWFKIKSISKLGSNSKIILSQDPGFTYDAETKTLEQAFFPHRLLSGKASVTLPSWFNIKKSESSDAISLKVRASGSLSVKLKGEQADEVRARFKDGEWQALPAQKEDGGLKVQLDFNTVSDEWFEVEIGK
ncbi:MAG: hypothetical protein NE330_02875, partial [Lentisphaeraceae bacterium]|nr:hypothetical protein [Lentisphaeraceae bacterium]